MLTGTGRGTRAARRVLMTHPDDMAGRPSSAERMSQMVHHILHRQHSQQQKSTSYNVDGYKWHINALLLMFP